MILTGCHQPAQDESRAEKPGWGRELDNKAVDDAKGCLRCPTSWQPFVWSQCSSWNWWWDDEMFIFAAKDGCRHDTLPLWSFSSAWFLQCAGHGEPHGWDCAMPSHYLSQLQHAGLLNAGLVWLVHHENVQIYEILQHIASTCRHDLKLYLPIPVSVKPAEDAAYFI